MDYMDGCMDTWMHGCLDAWMGRQSTKYMCLVIFQAIMTSHRSSSSHATSSTLPRGASGTRSASLVSVTTPAAGAHSLAAASVLQVWIRWNWCMNWMGWMDIMDSVHGLD